MKPKTIELLRERGIQPSEQRVSIADYVLNTSEHPSADRVWARVKKSCSVISRATVYNTLYLLVRKGLLRHFIMNDGKAVFDANIGSHHHFVDEESGRIYDIPWESVSVSKVGKLRGFDVKEYHVVMRGRMKEPDKGR